MDKGFIEGQVAVVLDQTEWCDFVVQTQDGDYHVDFDDGYYHQCVAKKLDGKTVRLGYYSMETNPDGTRWVQAGDDNTLEEMKTDEPLDEDEPPRRILKRQSKTINNVVKEVMKEEKKEVTAVKKMEKSQVRNNINHRLESLIKSPDVIVSMTTWKPRIQSGAFIKTIESIIQQKFNGTIKIVLTLHKDDEKFLSQKQKDLLSTNNIEIFICSVNLRPHLKYFFTMQRYRQIPIITIDDDNFYSPNMVQKLFDEYKKYGDKNVYSCRTHLIKYNPDGTARKYRNWIHEYYQDEPSFDLLATGVGGVLYPPNCLQITSSLISYICENSLTTDDLFLRKRETDLGIKVKSVNIGKSYLMMRDEYAAEYSLCCSDNISNNDINIVKLDIRNNKNEDKNKMDILIIYRICDKVEAVHGKREFGTKQDAIKKCFPTFCSALKEFQECQDKFSYKLTIVEDNIKNETKSYLQDELIKHNITYNLIPASQPGNIGSFKTCFNEALRYKDDQLVFFIEDDYICSINSFRELVLFYKMFDQKHNSIFINPTTDTGSLTNIPVFKGKYMSSAVLPSSKKGDGIWWRQTFHSTSSFATNVRNLKKYKYVFDQIFKQKELTEHLRNKIFYVCPCFQPLAPLFQHYQRHKTVYWFSKENNLPDVTYLDIAINGFNPQATINIK